MASWFLKTHQAPNNQVQGPFDELAVIAGLKEGRFTMLDLAYSIEEKKWQSLAQVEIFRAAVLAPELGAKTGEWTVLRCAGRDQGIMDGPFSLETIRRLLAAGELSFSDRVCHEGEKKWTRLGDRAEFDRSSPRDQNAEFNELELLKQIDSFSGELLLQNVLQLRPELRGALLPQEIVLEAREETDGLDLVALEDAARGYPGKVFGSTILSAFGILLFGLTLRAQPATMLDVIPLKLSSPSAVLVFQTDAPTNEPIHLKLTAKTGEVLERYSYSQKFEVHREPAELASFQLSPLHLPAGTYQVSATIGGVKKETSIFVGLKDAHFAEELDRHQKQISLRQQTEKKALYYSSIEFESLAKGLHSNYGKYRKNKSQWHSFLEGWKQKAKVAREKLGALDDASMAYPEEMATFKVATEKLMDEAGLLDAAIQQKREIASQTVSKQTSPLGREFAKFRKLASHLNSQPAIEP